MQLPIETFPALEHAGCYHGFVGRIPGIELSRDKTVVLENLEGASAGAADSWLG